jgi:Mg2+ and Co2+ transporter CorA
MTNCGRGTDDVRALQERVDANHRHMLVLHQDVKGDIQLLAEHHSDQMERLSEMSDRLSGVSDRLSDMSDILRRLDRGR